MPQGPSSSTATGWSLAFFFLPTTAKFQPSPARPASSPRSPTAGSLLFQALCFILPRDLLLPSYPVDHLFCTDTLCLSPLPFYSADPRYPITTLLREKQTRTVSCSKYELQSPLHDCSAVLQTQPPAHTRSCARLQTHLVSAAITFHCSYPRRSGLFPRCCSSRPPGISANMFAPQQYTDVMEAGRKRQRDEAELANGTSGFSEHRAVSNPAHLTAMSWGSSC